MSRLLPGFHASWDEADAAFQSFVDAFPERSVQLRERLEATGGPELDGTAASLDALNEWFIRIAFEDQDDGMDWWPTWKEPYDPQRIAEALVPVSPPHLLRLWELVAIYLADLCLAETEDARWVCWRGDLRRHHYNAKPLIDHGFKRVPCDPLGMSNAGVLRAYLDGGFEEGSPHAPDPQRLSKEFAWWRELRLGLAESEERSWQKAPFGRGAGTRVPKRPW